MEKTKGKKSEFIMIILLVIAIAVMCGFIVKKKLSEQGKNANIFENSKLVLYEGPKSLKDATEEDLKATSEVMRDFSLMHCMDTTVTVNGYDCYVYDTNVNHSRTWSNSYYPSISRTPITYFDFEGAAEIKVTVPGRELESVKISPVSYGIEPQIDLETSTITFTITEPDNYTLTFNGTPDRALHIFANPIETDIPDANDENVVYIGPGEWNIEAIVLEEGQTLYLSGGAVVHGVVNGNNTKNVTVKGRGIIDGSHYEGWKGKTAYVPLKFDNCENVTLEDIIVLNANAWVCQAYCSENGVIDGLRIISPRPNGDGISLQSCQNYEVKNCFVRSWDDSLVVKNYVGSSKDIYFHDTQLWTDFAQSMELGYETNKGSLNNVSMTNVTFENITVLNNFHKPVVSVHNADDALVSDILFKNIIVEDNRVGSGDASTMPYLIDINIAQSSNWSTTKERGTISNVTIENMQVLSGNFPKSRINGFDAEHKAENITIKNLSILGEDIKDFEGGKFEINQDTTANLVIE
ncbi:MAG: hypothetical protein IJN54_17670 [Lachnospiraceae bacterium]|nr:hypothetical protein [Lachnospiraceae bacterium]